MEEVVDEEEDTSPFKASDLGDTCSPKIPHKETITILIDEVLSVGQA